MPQAREAIDTGALCNVKIIGSDGWKSGASG